MPNLPSESRKITVWQIKSWSKKSGYSILSRIRRFPTADAAGPVPTPGQWPDVLVIPRKEVIQPHLPIRLPCYDLVPLTGFTLGASLLAVGTTTSGATNSGGLTGGVYKAQEHIHRGVADPRLLAIPASCGRIAAHNLN